MSKESNMIEEKQICEELGMTEEEYNDIEVSERKDREKLESKYQFY